MITESAYWRERLSRTATEIRRRQALRRFTERSLVGLEQDLMTGAFAARKLVDSNKVPDSVASIRVPIVAYPSVGRPITLLSRWHPERHYDFDAPRRKSASTRQVCNV